MSLTSPQFNLDQLLRFTVHTKAFQTNLTSKHSEKPGLQQPIKTSRKTLLQLHLLQNLSADPHNNATTAAAFILTAPPALSSFQLHRASYTPIYSKLADISMLAAIFCSTQ